jgi:hypothetical protein
MAKSSIDEVVAIYFDGNKEEFTEYMEDNGHTSELLETGSVTVGFGHPDDYHYEFSISVEKV